MFNAVIVEKVFLANNSSRSTFKQLLKHISVQDKKTYSVHTIAAFFIFPCPVTGNLAEFPKHYVVKCLSLLLLPQTTSPHTHALHTVDDEASAISDQLLI